MVEPGAHKAAVAHLCSEQSAVAGVSQRRACRLVGLARATLRYRSRPRLDDGLVARLEALSAERPCFGALRLHALLRREGRRVNHMV